MRDKIIKTIAYFDLYDWPLRAEEIWKWQISGGETAGLAEIISELHGLAKTVLEEKDGFYFLRGREDILNLRVKRYLFAERKYRRATRFAKIISLFPFVRMVAVCNDLGYGNAPDRSDIDIFVVSAPGRIWTARLFIAGFLKIFGLRPGETERDAICPSFFISGENLNLEKLALKNERGETDDIHFAYWLIQMTPVVERGITYEKFLQENSWVKKFLPDAFGCVPAKRKIKPLRAGGLLEAALNISGGFIEKCAKKMEMRALPEIIKNAANKNTNVIISDSVLKFHTRDSRMEIRNKFNEKIKNIN